MGRHIHQWAFVEYSKIYLLRDEYVVRPKTTWACPCGKMKSVDASYEEPPQKPHTKDK